MSILIDPTIILSLLTLSILEIVLGIDNLIIISILADKLPKTQQALARKVGLMAAFVTRVMLLSLTFWMAHLEKNIFSVLEHEISWRDLLLILGGAFLIGKSTLEIHNKIEENSAPTAFSPKQTMFLNVIIQIAFMDIIFSFDSVMTAIGVANHLPVMILAVFIAMLVMFFAVDQVGNFVSRHPTIKILALSYMLLIGMTLIASGLDVYIPKGYLYFAMAFSFFVEMINMATKKRTS